MKLSICIHQFFDRYLLHMKGVSPHTIKAYRDTFILFLPFAARYLSIKCESIMVEHLSPSLILAFLDHLETDRHNSAQTRNMRLATFKSFVKMIRMMYPQYKEIAQRLLNIPQKRTPKPLIGYLSHMEMLKVFDAVDLKTREGFRDYTVLQLLYDSGARASEITTLKINDFDPQQSSLAILGKGNRYRRIELWPRTVQLLTLYLRTYRLAPRLPYRDCLFINQRGQSLTRHGIYWLCKKYLSMALDAKRMKELEPVHSFRHSCAVNMLIQGSCITDIRNRLGHENIQSTMAYMHLDLSRKKNIQKKFIEYTQSILTSDPKIEELLDWEHKESILTWLDSL